MARQSLGRGLSALMGEEKPAATEATSTELDIDLIEPNPEQPRKRFAETNLDDLARSIRVYGIVQPIVVRKKGTRYQIVAGERRWRAAQRAELRRVPVVIKDVPDEQMLEIALIENIQRHELNPIEEANAYRKLIEQIGLSQEEIADRIGRERSLISTTIRLLKLPDDVQRHLVDGSLSLSHGRALLLTENESIQRVVANDAVEQSWSVRATEIAVRKLLKDPSQPIEKKEVTRSEDPNVKLAETKLMRHFTTNVKILPGKKGTGGKIEIEYYGTDDLDRIYQMLIKQ